MGTIISEWKEAGRTGVLKGQLELTYSVSSSTITFSNFKFRLKRTNINTDHETAGTLKYTLVIQGNTIFADATVSGVSIPNSGAVITPVDRTISSNNVINFGGNPSINVPISMTYEMPGTSLTQSTISLKESISKPISIDGLSTTIKTWYPTSYGQCQANLKYSIPLAMQSSTQGYLYIKNDVNNIWYRVIPSGEGSSPIPIGANAWFLRGSGNEQNPGTVSRIYGFYLNANSTLGNTYSGDLTATYTVPAPLHVYNLTVLPGIKWRLGYISQSNETTFLKRPDDIPSNKNGYTIAAAGNLPNSFTDSTEYEAIYLDNAPPSSSYYPKPDGNNEYIYQGLAYGSNDTTATADVMYFGQWSDGTDLYIVYRKNANTKSITYYVDSATTSRGTASKITEVEYYNSSGYKEGGGTRYSGASYTPTKTGYEFAGWSTYYSQTDNKAYNVDYKTLTEALDAGYTGNLYAVWAYPFNITTTYNSSNYGTITVQMSDSEGNLISNRSATNVTSYGTYYFDPNTQYSISINKRDSNITGYKIITTVNGTVTSTNVRTSNSTITGVLTANTTSINIQWYDDLTFYYGASNGSSTTVSADIAGWYNNEHVYNFTVPNATTGLSDSWVQGSWISANAINNINNNTVTLNCGSTYTNINLHNNKTFYAYYNRQTSFYYGLPNSTVNTTGTQYRIGNTYSQITAPSVSPPSNWTSFVGWRTNTTPANASYTGNSFSYISTNSPTFYAIYSRNIIFNYYNNQDGKTQTSLVQYLNTGSSSTSSVALPLLSSSTYGWSPNGWRTDTNNIAGSITSDPSPGYGIAAPTYNAVYRRYPQFDYDANGGNSTPSSTVSSTYQYYNTNNTAATAIALTIAGAISKTGSTFQGWLDGGVNRSAGSEVQFATSWSSQNPKTLIANWGTNSYYITAVSSDETKGTITRGGGSYDYGSSYLLEATPKTGYKFNQWQFSGGLNNNGTSNSNPYQGTMGTSGGTATAYFKGNSYSIKFNANGGSGSMSNQTGLEYGVGTVINKNAFTPPTGKSFIGWATSSNSSAEVVYSDGGIITFGTTTDNGIVNLYAKWGNQTYSITVSVENNIGGTVSTNKTSCEYGSSFTLTASPFTGYNFTRWTLSGGVGSGTFTSATYNGTMGASSGTAIATFTPITSTITFNRNNGSGGTGSITATYGQAMPSITLPTRTNYRFVGYYDASTGGTQYYTASGGSAKNWDKTSNTTLYAHWEQTSNNVTLDNQGGIGSTSVQATNGNTMPAVNPPTREGHRFLGYFDNSTGGVQYYTNSGTSARNWDKTGNQTLYAHWQFIGIRVFHNGAWQKAIPYVFHNSQWRTAEAYVYTNNTWCLCGDSIVTTPTVVFNSISLSSGSTVAVDGTTYTISASPTNADNQTVTITVSGDGYLDNNMSTTTKTMTLTSGSGSFVVKSKATTTNSTGTITVTPAYSDTGTLSTSRSVTYTPVAFTSVSISGNSSTALAYNGTRTFTINATPTYAGQQYAYLYNNNSNVGAISGATTGTYNISTTGGTVACTHRVTLTSGSGQFILTNNSSSSNTQTGEIFIYVCSPSNTSTACANTSTGTINYALNPNIPSQTLQTFTETFNDWKTSSSIDSSWKDHNGNAVQTNTVLSYLKDNNNSTYLNLRASWQSKSANITLSLDNAQLTYQPETISNISLTIVAQNTGTNNSLQESISCTITTPSNNDTDTSWTETNKTSGVSTYTKNITLNNLKTLILSSSNQKTFSLQNTLQGTINYVMGAASLNILEMHLDITYSAYV